MARTVFFLIILDWLGTGDLCIRKRPTVLSIRYSSQQQEVDRRNRLLAVLGNIESIIDIWNYLGCTEEFSTDPPLHSHSTHGCICERFAYPFNVVGPERSTIAPLSEETGFNVAVKAKLRPDKGRGVSATEPIPKRSLIRSTRQTARFEDGPSYKKFLASLPAELAFDVLLWTYVQKVLGDDGQKRMMISVDLDEESYLTGDSPISSAGTRQWQTWGATKKPRIPGGCKENYFALRDIQPNEELLLQYSSFAIREGWKEFGLQI